MNESAKINKLRSLLRGFDGLLVAFSGGVDSTLLLRVAQEELGKRVLAVTLSSPLHTPAELAEARRLAAEIGAQHRIVIHNLLDEPNVANNPPDRCYHCKLRIMGELVKLAEVEGFAAVADGSNASDDAGDRPGLRALGELGIRSPLREAGLTKAEIRSLARELGLPNWNKSARPCLATRFPFGEALDQKRLERVDRAEEYLRGILPEPLRVRSHGEIARIELGPPAMPLLLEHRQQIVEQLKKLSFHYVTVDLDGFRSGSMKPAEQP